MSSLKVTRGERGLFSLFGVEAELRGVDAPDRDETDPRRDFGPYAFSRFSITMRHTSWLGLHSGGAHSVYLCPHFWQKAHSDSRSSFDACGVLPGDPPRFGEAFPLASFFPGHEVFTDARPLGDPSA